MLAGPPPTEVERRQVFEKTLAEYARGKNPGLIPCWGFDTQEVFAALEGVRQAAPHPPAELLDAARAAFDNRHAVASRRQQEILHRP